MSACFDKLSTDGRGPVRPEPVEGPSRADLVRIPSGPGGRRSVGVLRQAQHRRFEVPFALSLSKGRPRADLARIQRGPGGRRLSAPCPRRTSSPDSKRTWRAPLVGALRQAQGERTSTVGAEPVEARRQGAPSSTAPTTGALPSPCERVLALKQRCLRGYDRSGYGAGGYGIDLDCLSRGAAGAVDRGAAARLVHHLRERPGAAAGAVAGRHAGCSRSTRPTAGSRSSRVGGGGLTHARLGAGRPRAGRGRGAQRRRGLGRQPPLRQRQRRRRRRDAAARRAHAAGRRRAARHRLRRADRRDGVFTRAFITTARRGQNLPAGAAGPQLTTPGMPRAARVGVRRRDLGAALGGTPLRDRARCSATRRARWRRRPTAARSTPPSSTPATRPPRCHEGAVCNGGASAPPVRSTASRCPAACPRRACPAACRANANVEGRRGPRSA